MTVLRKRELSARYSECRSQVRTQRLRSTPEAWTSIQREGLLLCGHKAIRDDLNEKQPGIKLRTHDSPNSNAIFDLRHLHTLK